MEPVLEFVFGKVEPVLEYEDDEEPEFHLLDGYINAVQDADDAGKSKFVWQMWKLGTMQSCRHLSKIEQRKALELLSTLATAMLAGLEVKRQTARAFAYFTADPGGRKIIVNNVQGLVALVQTLLKVDDQFTQCHALKCIIQLCGEERLSKDFIGSRLGVEVLDLCDSEIPDVVLNAVLALQGLGAHPEIRSQLAFNDRIVKMISFLLENEDMILIYETINLFAVVGADFGVLDALTDTGSLRTITALTEPVDAEEELLLTYIYMLHSLGQGADQKTLTLLKKNDIFQVLIDLMHRSTIPIAGTNENATQRSKQISKRVISWTLQVLISKSLEEEEVDEEDFFGNLDCDILMHFRTRSLVSILRWKLENLYDPFLLSLSMISDDDDDAVIEMIDLGLTSDLIQILFTVNPELEAVETYMTYASRILANIASSGRNGPHGIINNEGIQATCTLAEQQYRHTKDQEIQLNCAAILANICGDDFGKVSVVEAGALEIIRMQGDINKQGEDVVRTAMLSLYCISENDELNLNLVEEHVLPAIFRVIAAKEYDDSAVDYAKSVLVNFLRCGGHEVFPDTIGDDEEYQLLAGQAIVILGQEDAYHDLLVNPGVLWILVAMTSNVDVHNQANAAKFIADLSLTDRYRVAIARHGGLEALDRLSSSTDVDVLREVVRAMRNLCRDPVLMVKIVEFGGIQLFAQYSLSQDLEVQLFTVEALSNFCVFPETYERMREDGGFSALLSLTSHTDVEIATEACRAMAIMSAAGNEFHEMIVESAMGPLIEIIMEGQVACQVQAINTIHGVALNPDYHIFLDEKQIPHAMLALLRDKNRVLCHPGACNVLAALALCQKSADMLVDEEHVIFLLSLLNSQNYEVFTHAAHIFANLTFSEAGQEALSELLIFPHILRFTSKQPRNSLAAYYGGMTIAQLIRAEDADTDIYEDFARNHGCIGEALVDARDDDYNCQLAMAKAINILAESEYPEYAKIMSVPSSVLRQVLLSLEVSESQEVKRLVALSLCKVLGDSATIKDTGPMLGLMTSGDAAAKKMASEIIASAELVPTGEAGEGEYMSQEDVHNLVLKANLLASGGDNAAYQHAAKIYRTLASQQTCHDGLIKNGGLEKLVMLCNVEDNDIIVSAVFALGGLSIHPEFHKFMMTAGTLRQLLPAANLQNQQIQTYLASMLSNLAVAENADVMIAAEGFLEILCRMMAQRNITLLRQASRSLLVFIHSEAHRQEMRHNGMSKILVELVHTKDSKVYTTVLTILYALTLEEYGIISIEREGGIQAILLSTKGKGMQDQLLAGRCICQICAVEECQGTVIESGALSLIQLCAQSAEAEDQQHAGLAIAYCTTKDETRTKFMRAGGVPVVVQLSMSDDENAQVSAAKALSDLSTDPESHDLMLQNGVINPLLAITSMSSALGVRHAVRAVAHLCSSEPYQVEIGQADEIQHFERSWRVHDLEIARWVNLAMARMTALKSNQQRMMDMWGGDEDGFETLVKTHVIHDDLYIRRCGILALSNIASNEDFVEELCEDKMLHLLCVCAKREGQDEEVQHYALKTLCCLMLSDDHRMYMAEHEKMTLLAINNTTILKNSFPRLQEQSYTFLAKIAACDEIKSMLYEAKVTECLMSGLKHKNIQVIGAVCMCIAAVSYHNAMRKIMLQQDLISVLMTILHRVESSKSVTLQVMSVLAVLAEDPASNEAISEHEGRDKVLQLSQQGDSEIREIAIKIVGRMSDVCDVALVLEALESGEASSVALAKYYGNVNHQRRVATKIAKLAILPKHHQKIIDMGGIRDLITLAFSDDEHVQSKTASALTDLAKIESSRVALILEGALKPIVSSLMQSPFESVRTNALNCLQTLSWIRKSCIHELKVVEPLVEGIPIRPFGMFVGGQEGASQHRWYRVEPGAKGKLAPAPEKSATSSSPEGSLKDKDASSTDHQELALTSDKANPNSLMAAPAEGGNVEKWEAVKEDGENALGFFSEVAQAVQGAANNLGIASAPDQKADMKEVKSEQFDLVEIARTRNYTPTHDDIGFTLRYCWTPLDVMGVRGETATFTSSGPALAGPPSCADVQVSRVHPDDALLVGCATYSGGEEGSSLFAWKRVYKNGRKEIIQGCYDRTYYPERVDIGCRIIFGYIPVRSDGVRGNIVWSEPSDTIATMPPSFREFKITGVCQEGRMLYPDGKFLGGREGSHEVQWSRKDPGDENFGSISTNEGMTRTYEPTQRDIGCILRVRMKPENEKGDQGKALFAETAVIEHGYPLMKDFRISGGPFHTGLLLAAGNYFGGFEGNSIIQWYRSVFGGPYLPIKCATNIGYQPTIDDVSARVSCKYIPVRDDGRKGPMVEGKAVPLGIDPKVQNLVSRMLIFGDAQFKVMLKTNEGTEPRIFVMDRDGIKVQAGKTVEIPSIYDADTGYNVSGDSDGTEIKASWSEDIRVVLHPTDVRTFMIIFDESEETDDGLIKFEYVADSHKARDVIGLCIRSFCAFCLQTYASKKTRKKSKRETTKEGVKKHRMAWLKEIQGRVLIEDTLVEINDKHQGSFAIEYPDQISDVADSDANLTDRNDASEMNKEEEMELYGNDKDDAQTVANTNANSNPLFDPEQEPVAMSAHNKYSDIQGLLKDKGIGVYGKDYEGEHVDPQQKARAHVQSKLSKVTALLAALPSKPRAKPKLDDAPKALGSMGMVPGLSAEGVDLHFEETSKAQLALPSMGVGISPSEQTLALTSVDANPLALAGSSASYGGDTNRSTGSTSSFKEKALTPAQRAMAGIAKHIKKKKTVPGEAILEIGAPPSKDIITTQNALSPGITTSDAVKAERPRRGSRDASARGSSSTPFKAAPTDLSSAGDDTARSNVSTTSVDSTGQPKKLTIVGGTLDRIKALANKSKKEREANKSIEQRLLDQAAQISADQSNQISVEKTELEAENIDSPSSAPTPKETSLAIVGVGMDTDRNTRSMDTDRSTRSTDSTASSRISTSGLKGSLMGGLLVKQKVDTAAATQALVAPEAIETNKSLRLSREERLQEFLEKKAGKRRKEENASLGIQMDASKAVTHSPSEKNNSVMEEIAQAKLVEKRKKVGMMINRKKKEPSPSPKALTVAALTGVEEPTAASTIKLADEHVFMCRGAFFVTGTEGGEETATVKVSLSKTLDTLTWKSHTERKEYAISISNIVNIDAKAVLRVNREQLSFAINSKCPETWDDKQVIFEAISERAKVQWVEALVKLSSENAPLG